MKKILFICLGNICRSPMAEYLFRSMAAERGIPVHTASAGTSGWHDGEGMHCGTADVLDGQPEKIFKITDLLPASSRYDHVPDPWYTGNFNETRAILTACCDALLTRLQNGAM